MKDLRELPRNSAVRKINELVKRVRLCKVHAYIISYLKEQMPSMFGKEKAQRDLINDLPNVFRTVMKRHNLAAGDFSAAFVPHQAPSEVREAVLHCGLLLPRGVRRLRRLGWIVGAQPAPAPVSVLEVT